MHFKGDFIVPRLKMEHIFMLWESWKSLSQETTTGLPFTKIGYHWKEGYKYEIVYVVNTENWGVLDGETKVTPWERVNGSGNGISASGNFNKQLGIEALCQSQVMVIQGKS